MNQKTDDRVSTIKRIGNCLNCLRSGHVLKHCTSSSTCRKCGKQHHTLLHYNNSGRGSSSTSTQPPQDNTPQPTTQNIRSKHQFQLFIGNYTGALKTAVVDIEDSSGNKKPCRVLLDDGSESSFMTDSCAKSLGLQRRKQMSTYWYSGSTNAHAKWKVNVRIFSQVNDSLLMLKV
ncbi:Gag-Pol polyprotein [Orchesella cincta]|uniref:Gag-Pol polyprotein n=1 Tax=Orchesella cincta TaxID=48709 RepID=A0A1D2M5R2_ORCCI|nr:Gag-Pol polyprotein [Orchesella cincta]